MIMFAAPPEPDATPPNRRTLGRWFTLIVVWLLGLGVWAVYIAVLLLLFYRIFV